MTQPTTQSPPPGPPPLPFAVASSLARYLLPPSTLSPTPHLPHPIDRYIASAFVFDASSRLLLVQRSASDAWPLFWEMPGGCVDPPDPSVLHAAARELKEEAGLTVTAFAAAADSFSGGTRWPHVWTDDRGCVWCRLAFVVEVEAGGAVVLDEREHQDFVWATEEDVREGRAEGGRVLGYVTPEQREILLEGFRVRKEVERARTVEGVGP